ncbi:MAG: hypothetical protein QQW96_22595 [Tychonema bourrellyi B0820]|uniref:hypothetical protein n=1 Tax=Tychonema bourrellyi TaxID=54313 RepID=UPI00117CA8C6|nr:hypothetical protein [Tychonema bourrellyi]MDQ2100425.1 hypothetical protein [Tychonema bourrellyi B0820]
MILAEGDRFFTNSGAIALTPPNPTRSKHFFIFLWIKRIVFLWKSTTELDASFFNTIDTI